MKLATRPLLAGLCLASLAAGGCATGRPGSGAGDPEETHVHAAAYQVSCSVSDECRVTYIDGDGQLKARDIVGEWRREFGTDPGERLWVRAGAGGCPPRPVRVEILIDERKVAEHLARPPGGWRCEWILAETEFRVP